MQTEPTPPSSSGPVTPEPVSPEPVTPITPSPAPNQPAPHHQIHGLLPALQSLFYIIVIAVFIITFTVQPFRIPSGSMEPTLLIGDFLLVDKQDLGLDTPRTFLPASAIHRGDIIIFHFPIDPSMHLIKRVIGMPGDHLRLHDGRVYIDGQPLTEPYAVYRPGSPDPFRDSFPRLQSTAPDIDPAWWIEMHQLVDHGELIIPTGNYFVLGDNRNGSEDSRYWGFVPRSAIVGKPLVIYFSLQSGAANESAESAPSPSPDLPHRSRNILNFARWDRIFEIPR
jgi:signal peptidase I